MNANNNPSHPCHYVHPSEVKGLRSCNHIIRFIVTAIHELLGHGTGNLLTETSSGTFNFDRVNLPINPLTGQAIKAWYKPGQTWTSVFEKLATSVEGYRAMLISYYLADDREVLSIFGYDDTSIISADGRQYPYTNLPHPDSYTTVIYYVYLHIGVEGILALQTFNAQDQA
jgi:dipeptidyl-peptidase-3